MRCADWLGKGGSTYFCLLGKVVAGVYVRTTSVPGEVSHLSTYLKHKITIPVCLEALAT